MLLDLSTAMSGLVTALQSVLTVDNFMTSFTALIPVIGGVLIFAFVYRIVRRMLTKAPKGKVGI